MTEQNETPGSTESEPLPGLSADTAELETLNNQNKARLLALHRQGVNVDPASVLSMRIDELAQMVLGEGSARLVEYKLLVQRKLAEALRELEGQVRQAQMAAAAQVTPEQMEQMAKANGLRGLRGPDGRPLRG